MPNAQKPKQQTNDDCPVMSLEEIARRMLATPAKMREKMTQKKPKPRKCK